MNTAQTKTIYGFNNIKGASFVEDKIKELDKLQAELRGVNIDTEENRIKYNRVQELIGEIYDFKGVF